MSVLSWMRLARRLALEAGLTCTYLLLVTPLAWFARAGGTRPLDSAGWVPIRMDSDDRGLYLDAAASPAGRRGFFWKWLRLILAYRRLALGTPVPWSWLILVGLVPWAGLAKPPKEAELSSDLYVLF